jgi:hypothetical protein
VTSFLVHPGTLCQTTVSTSSSTIANYLFLDLFSSLKFSHCFTPLMKIPLKRERENRLKAISSGTTSRFCCRRFCCRRFY